MFVIFQVGLKTMASSNSLRRAAELAGQDDEASPGEFKK